MTRWWRFIPAVLLALFVAAAAWRLTVPPDPTIRSQMTGKPVPQFSLPPAAPGKAGLRSEDLADGKPKLLNIFASWCLPCIDEMRQLGQLHRGGVQIEGIAIRDAPDDVVRFLQRNGDPFTRIGSDTASQVQLAFGSSGVPESFIVDGRGVIRFQHVGPITAADLPLIRAEMEKAR